MKIRTGHLVRIFCFKRWLLPGNQFLNLIQRPGATSPLSYREERLLPPRIHGERQGHTGAAYTRPEAEAYGLSSWVPFDAVGAGRLELVELIPQVPVRTMICHSSIIWIPTAVPVA
jgi:hypothetical protein